MKEKIITKLKASSQKERTNYALKIRNLTIYIILGSASHMGTIDPFALSLLEIIPISFSLFLIFTTI